VAVKVVTKEGANRPADEQKRELDILRRMDHINIVKVIAIEEQLGRHHAPVAIIMELCEGSLVDILKQPQHFECGLPESEFILVYKHVSAGLKYLRACQIIHRDLKPGNILKYVGDDGLSIYKLADFGAARLLQENEGFQSLVGTSEYLHPDMYLRAMLPKAELDPSKQFSASTDLWSLGVTLYHVAAGSLPFRPRKVSAKRMHQVMYNMTTRKESGVISAYEDEAGVIRVNKNLPSKCLLGNNLKSLITPLLAKLMEAEPNKQLTYEDFFEQSDKIFEMATFHIFYVNKCKLFTVYIDLNSGNGYEELLSQIGKETELRRENILILYKGETLTSMLKDGKLQFTEIPLPTEDFPLVLCDKESSDVTYKIRDKDRQNSYAPFPNIADLSRDAQIAQYNQQLAYEQLRRISSMTHIEKLLHYSVRMIHQVVTAQLTLVSKENEQTNNMMNSLESQLNMMKAFNRVCRSFVSLTPETTSGHQEAMATLERMNQCCQKRYGDFKKVKDEIKQRRPLLAHLLADRQKTHCLLIEWEKDSATVMVSNENGKIR